MLASGTQEESLKSLAVAATARLVSSGLARRATVGSAMTLRYYPHPRFSSESHCPFPRIDRELPMLPLCLISFELKPQAHTASGNFLLTLSCAALAGTSMWYIRALVSCRSPPWLYCAASRIYSQREIIDALEEELRIGGKPLKLTVSEVKPDGPALFKIFIDSTDSSHGLDESLEGAAASWPGPAKGTADVLSVSAEHDQINLRYLSGPPPEKAARSCSTPRDIWKRCGTFGSHRCLQRQVWGGSRESPR